MNYGNDTGKTLLQFTYLIHKSCLISLIIKALSKILLLY